MNRTAAIFCFRLCLIGAFVFNFLLFARSEEGPAQIPAVVLMIYVLVVWKRFSDRIIAEDAAIPKNESPSAAPPEDSRP